MTRPKTFVAAIAITMMLSACMDVDVADEEMMSLANEATYLDEVLDDGVHELGYCYQEANCWDGSTVSCSRSSSSGTCTHVDSNCAAGQRGFVDCGLGASWCPPCPPSPCDLPTIGGELDNGQYLAFAPTVNEVCQSVRYETDMFFSPGVTSVTWQKTTSSPAWAPTWGQTGDDLWFRFEAQDQTASFRISATNACGTTVRDFKFKSVCDCGSPVSANAPGDKTLIPTPPPCSGY